MTARRQATATLPFTQLAQQLPFAPRGQNAVGLLTCLTRAVGHIGIVAIATAHMNSGTEAAELPTPLLSDDEVVNEITHAKEHWDVHTTPGSISTATAAKLDTFDGLLTTAAAEFADWDTRTRADNARTLYNAAAALATDLDRDLVGIRNSDPGSSL